jgi:hypothetical protein
MADWGMYAAANLQLELFLVDPTGRERNLNKNHAKKYTSKYVVSAALYEACSTIALLTTSKPFGHLAKTSNTGI